MVAEKQKPKKRSLDEISTSPAVPSPPRHHEAAARGDLPAPHQDPCQPLAGEEGKPLPNPVTDWNADGESWGAFPGALASPTAAPLLLEGSAPARPADGLGFPGCSSSLATPCATQSCSRRSSGPGGRIQLPLCPCEPRPCAHACARAQPRHSGVSLAQGCHRIPCYLWGRRKKTAGKGTFFLFCSFSACAWGRVFV